MIGPPRPGGSTAPPAHAGGLLVWLGALACVVAGLHALGSGALSGPPLEPAAWSAWAEARPPLLLIVAVLRLGTLALGWYLLTVSMLGVVVRSLQAATLVRLADAVTLPALRRWLQQLFAGSVATAVLAAPLPASVAHARPPVALETVADAGATGAHRDVPSDDATSRQMRRPVPLRIAEVDTEAPDVGAPGQPREAPASDEREVRPGESLWHIAADVLTAHLGREAAESEVADYWLALQAANRDRLAVPDEPDLIFPGQRFLLPAPPPAPERLPAR